MLGARIKYLRESKGMSQAELAVAVGLSPTGLWKIEIGRTKNPGIGTLEKLAAVLGLSSVNDLTRESQVDEQRGTYRTGDVDKLRKWEWFAERWKAGDPETFVEMAANLPADEQAIIARIVKLMELEQHLG